MATWSNIDGQKFNICFSYRMFGRLATSHNIAHQTIFVYGKQMCLKYFVIIAKQVVLAKQCFATWRNEQISNV